MAQAKRAATVEAAVRFRTSRNESELGELLAQLVHGQIALSQFREVQTDLESAYMSFAANADGESATTVEEG